MSFSQFISSVSVSDIASVRLVSLAPRVNTLTYIGQSIPTKFLDLLMDAFSEVEEADSRIIERLYMELFL